MSKQQILSSAKIITLALIVALGVRSIAAFSNPPGAPPACPSGYPGCDAPLNAGPTAQSKAGALTVNASSSGMYPTGLYVFGQTVLDNSALATSAVKIVDGNQHAGYVLTSDGNGNATWSAPTGGSGGGGMSVVTGTARSSDGTTTITLPAGNWKLTVFAGYPNCVDHDLAITLDGSTIGTRTGIGDPQGCMDSTISGTAVSVAGGSHKLSLVGNNYEIAVRYGEQFWYWTATGGTGASLASSLPDYDVAAAGFSSLAAGQGFLLNYPANDATVLCGLGYYSSGASVYSDSYGRNPGAIICAPSTATAAYSTVTTLTPSANHNPSGSASIGSTNYNYSGDTKTANQYCVVQGYTAALYYSIGVSSATVWKWNGSAWAALSGSTNLASATCGR